jgi:hypothetical protein
VSKEPKPPPPAAATENDALFAAKAALKLAARQRRDADTQFDHLQRVIERLERKSGSQEQ